MKNPIAAFTICISIILSGLISACGSLPTPPVNAGLVSVPTSVSQNVSDSPASPWAAVRIIHTWYEHQDGAYYQHIGYSLGTVIGPGVILTHNHFGFDPESGDRDALTFITSTGQVFTLQIDRSRLVPAGCTHTVWMLDGQSGSLAASYVGANTGCKYPLSSAALSIDEGTQIIIHLPGNVTLTPVSLGDQALIDRLAVGTWLAVDYWDESRHRLAQGRFQIMRLEHGVATLADPQCLISPGDSGGGAYLNGQLIGNTWARYADPNTKRPTGAFIVALVPAEATPLLKQP